ncbi:GGDEF domain-containing protein [Paenibacillus caui]|uniref:GGDEF domain-containing protein n=1 Tax=Paenibacillus caui TaxID=2873927 RepID=UPI001CA7F268
MINLTDVTEQTLLQEKLHNLATIDSLTQTLSRGYFIEKSREALEKNCLRNEPLSLILFDLDHFKKINDRYGHDWETMPSGMLRASAAVTSGRKICSDGMAGRNLSFVCRD